MAYAFVDAFQLGAPICGHLKQMHNLIEYADIGISRYLMSWELPEPHILQACGSRLLVFIGAKCRRACWIRLINGPSNLAHCSHGG